MFPDRITMMRPRPKRKNRLAIIAKAGLALVAVYIVLNILMAVVAIAATIAIGIAIVAVAAIIFAMSRRKA